MLSKTINIIDCGLKDYQSVLLLQENAVKDLQTGTGKDTVFIVEHQPVITLGARDSANKLLKDSRAIEKAGIEIVQIRRGGGTTAHNPGQLVIYPIINLKKHLLGVGDFVHLLEKIGIELLAELGVKCETKKGLPGLWIEDKETANYTDYANVIENKNPLNPRNPWLTKDRKIASIGVQIKKWITCHGLAININNDLSIFDLIVPCGLDDVKMTSAEKELGKKVNMNNAKDILKKILLENFAK